MLVYTIFPRHGRRLRFADAICAYPIFYAPNTAGAYCGWIIFEIFTSNINQIRFLSEKETSYTLLTEINYILIILLN